MQEHFKKAPSEAVLQKLHEIADAPDAPQPARGASRAYPLSSYIKRKYKGRVYGLIADELHQYNNKSGQGDAMAELYDTAKKVVGMTATLINGYSSGIFYLLYRIAPFLMKRDGKDYENPTEFDREYGVLQTTYEETEPEYNSNRRTVQSRSSTKLLPGVSPLVYSRFLMECAVFLSLTDMGKDLPEYEEIPIPVSMPPEVQKEYDHVEDILKGVLKNDRKAAKKILSAYLNLLTAYPDQPYGQKPIYHPINGYEIVAPKDTAAPDSILPKDEAVLEIVERKIKVMEAEGVTFVTGADVGKEIKADKLLKDFDRVILACGASNPRDLNVPGRDAKGIYFAVDFLKANTKSLLDSGFKDGKSVNVRDKNVVIIGGGDTGNDCVGTSIRHGCKSVTQIEMMPKAPDNRAENNPWPQWPKVCKTDYGQEEAIALFGHDPRIYESTVKEFVKDKNGNLKAVKIVKLRREKDEAGGRMAMKEVEGSEQSLPAEESCPARC